MTNLIKLSVALCTYNGAKFLSEQLASILGQARLPDELIVCDDGSADGTVGMLESFAEAAPFPVTIHRNAVNLGAVANFHKAVSLCTGNVIALADQDDVWTPDKLARAVRGIELSGVPESTLYCARLEYVDSACRTLGLSRVPHKLGFANAVVENIATGCSVVFGEDIRRRFLDASPADMVMHDWWLYLVASAFGRVTYDEAVAVYYRQHSLNVAGWQPRPAKIAHRTGMLIKRIKRGPTGMDSLNQARRFIKTYSDTPEEMRALVEELLNLRDENFLRRVSRSMSLQIARNDPIENFGLKAMIVLGWH